MNTRTSCNCLFERPFRKPFYVVSPLKEILNRFNIRQFCVLPTKCINVFCVELRKGIIPLYRINWFVSIIESECVRCLQKGQAVEDLEMREHWIQNTSAGTLRFLCFVQCLEDGSKTANRLPCYLASECPVIVPVLLLLLLLFEYPRHTSKDCDI